MTDAAPFRLQTLHETAAVKLSRFDHPPGAALEESVEQAAERFQINFVERGCFRLNEYTLGPGSIFLSRPGEVYRYSHLHDVEADVCLSIAFSTPVEAARLALVPPVTNRINILKLQLSDDLDAAACELVDALEDARERALLESGMGVTDVCYEAGFRNPRHFTRSFRRYFGSLQSAHVMKRVRS
jgi:hypothetical protein